MPNLKAEIKYIDLGVAIGALLDMASDYADIDECKEETIKMCARELMKLPTIEAEPVKHGRWKKHTYDGEDFFGNPREIVFACNCSVCGRDGRRETNYCPNCGAKMGEEEPCLT